MHPRTNHKWSTALLAEVVAFRFFAVDQSRAAGSRCTHGQRAMAGHPSGSPWTAPVTVTTGSGEEAGGGDREVAGRGPPRRGQGSGDPGRRGPGGGTHSRSGRPRQRLRESSSSGHGPRAGHGGTGASGSAGVPGAAPPGERTAARSPGRRALSCRRGTPAPTVSPRTPLTGPPPQPLSVRVRGAARAGSPRSLGGSAGAGARGRSGGAGGSEGAGPALAPPPPRDGGPILGPLEAGR